MCGINFLYDSSVPIEDLQRRLTAGLECLRHRGPDDTGLWCGGAAALGHRRLSIVDLAGSRQPMADPDGRFVLSFNGEIYNYRELRERLSGRWAFRTAGDTEVLLAGLVLDGVRFLSGMEGMWAFLLWDARERRLLAARDRFGKKPLFYRAAGARFLAASELPALRAMDDAEWQEDLDGTADFLRYGYYLPGRTAYREVSEVRPGDVLRWSPEHGVTTEPWWSVPVDAPAIEDERELHRALREAFFTAVQRRLVADVEVGAFLSGGVDSSLIVSTLVREFGLRPQLFTMGFTDETFDERVFARRLAGELGVPLTEAVLDRFDPQELLALLDRHVGQPFGDVSLLPTAKISELAARSVKVVLSGDGGDELFAGYERYLGRAMFDYYRRIPRWLRAPLRAAIRIVPEPTAHHSRSLMKKARLFVDSADRLDAAGPYVAPEILSASEIATLAPELANRGHGFSDTLGIDDAPPVRQMMLRDLLVYLPQDILQKVDRASMAHSLEARAPFLDSAVARLAVGQPVARHRPGLRGKALLRGAFSDLLPDWLWRRRKQGFGVPVHAWFRGALDADLDGLLAGGDAPVERRAVREFVAEHAAGRRDHGYRLWNLYVYLVWRERGRWRRG